MPEDRKKFHEFALQSSLFKGHRDWYICYLKSEKLGGAFRMLAQKSAETLDEVAHAAAHLPHAIVHFAAGEMSVEVVLADIFSILSLLRMATIGGEIALKNSIILEKEYEQMVHDLAADANQTFISPDDLMVPQVPLSLSPVSAAHAGLDVKDIIKDIKDNEKDTKGRASLILDFVAKKGGVSIKDIAKAVRGCSEKTIQRELLALIAKRLIRKEGERRWSLYYAVGK